MHSYCQNHNKKTKNRVFLNLIKGLFSFQYRDIVVKPIINIEEKVDPASNLPVVHTESVRIKLSPETILFAHKINLKENYFLNNEYLAYQVHLSSGQVYNCLKIYGAKRAHIYPENLQQIIQDYQEINRFAKYRNWFLIAMTVTPVLEWWKNQPLILNFLNKIWTIF